MRAAAGYNFGLLLHWLARLLHAFLKHMHNLSDEVLCARWLENPYCQFFCGELSFCHKLPFDRSMTQPRVGRMGDRFRLYRGVDHG